MREIRNGVPRLICGDQFRLEHILSNFVSNDIKFSSEDSTITVVVSYETHYPDMVTFSVFDQGIGISEENQNKLFKVFSQIDAGKNQKGNGSGLGLSICKNLIELHQGEIGCNSSERTNPNDPTSGGSEFYFCVVHDEEYMQEYIREHGDELGEEGEKSARNNAAQIQEFLSTKSFMVVDDAVSNCKMLARLLSQRSCKVVDTAFNGLELLDATLYYKPGRVNFYDFIFIDSNMPKMVSI